MSDSNRDNLLIEQCLKDQQSSFSELIDESKIWSLAYPIR